MTTRSKPRVYRSAPRPIQPGTCTVCHRPTTITSTGRRRRHLDNDGRDCPGGGVRVETPTIPAEVLSSARITIPPATDRKPTKAPRGKGVRPRPTGHCHTCDRPISGERIYCGPCYAARSGGRS